MTLALASLGLGDTSPFFNFLDSRESPPSSLKNEPFSCSLFTRFLPPHVSCEKSWSSRRRCFRV